MLDHIVEVLKEHLGENNHEHASYTDRHSDLHLSLVGVFKRNFHLVLSVRVDLRLRLEFVTFCCYVLEVTNEPFIGDLVLFADPTLIEECHPDHHNDTIDKTEWRVEPFIGRGSI